MGTFLTGVGAVISVNLSTMLFHRFLLRSITVSNTFIERDIPSTQSSHCKPEKKYFVLNDSKDNFTSNYVQFV